MHLVLNLFWTLILDKLQFGQPLFENLFSTWNLFLIESWEKSVDPIEKPWFWLKWFLLWMVVLIKTYQSTHFNVIFTSLPYCYIDVVWYLIVAKWLELLYFPTIHHLDTPNLSIIYVDTGCTKLDYVFLFSVPFLIDVGQILILWFLGRVSTIPQFHISCED